MCVQTQKSFLPIQHFHSAIHNQYHPLPCSSSIWEPSYPLLKLFFISFFFFCFFFFLFYFFILVKWNQKSSKQSIKYKNHSHLISCFNHFFFLFTILFSLFFKSVIKLTITNQMFQNQSSINSFFLHFDSCSISKHVCYCTPSTITL